MIISRTPFRVSFVGGGSDLPAFCDRQKGAVLSVGINKAMYVTLHPYFDPNRTLLRYSKVELVDHLSKVEHPIFREAMDLCGIEGGLEISSTADIPSGTGMGSSSAFTVGLLHVLHAHQNRFVSAAQLAEQASHLEINVLGEPIGRQDQYAAAFGGLNVIEFHAEGRVQVEPLTLKREVIASLEDSLLLFYTGQQRQTRSVLADQSKNVLSDEARFESQGQMVKLVYQMRDALYAESLADFGALLHENWGLKKSLSTKISNPAIDEAYQAALDAGASGGKLLGAGGGGFLLLFCLPEHQASLRAKLTGLKELPFGFDFSGSRIIFTDGHSAANA